MTAVMGSVPPEAWVAFGVCVAMLVAVGVHDVWQARREHRSGDRG